MGYIAYIKTAFTILKVTLESKETLNKLQKGLKNSDDTIVKVESAVEQSKDVLENGKRTFLRIIGKEEAVYGYPPIPKPQTNDKELISQWVIDEYQAISNQNSFKIRKFLKEKRSSLKWKNATEDEREKMIYEHISLQHLLVSPRWQTIIDCESPLDEEDWKRIEQAEDFFKRHSELFNENYGNFARNFYDTDKVVSAYFTHKNLTYHKHDGRVFADNSWKKPVS